MKEFHMGLADPSDTAAITSILTMSWRNEVFDPERIAEILTEPEHATHVAVSRGIVVGFIDAFATMSGRGTFRWELDLMAVRPDWRRRGVGKELIEVSVMSGRERGMAEVRGLVSVSNTVSQRTLVSSGFSRCDEMLALWVHRGKHSSFTMCIVIRQAHLIQVNTMRYSGVWLEGEVDPEGIQSILSSVGSDDLAGVLVPVKDDRRQAVLTGAHFEEQGMFQWWVKDIIP